MRSIANSKTGVWGAVALAALSVQSCSKSSTPLPPPTSFGVNITVDASKLSAAQRSMVKLGSLLVSGAESLSKPLSVVPEISTGQLTFQYIPAPSVTSGTENFQFDAIDSAGELYGTGTSGPVMLVAGTAVAAKITLTSEPGTSKAIGAHCTAGTECGSGFCTDNYCCQEACHDTCASCALPATLGLCTAYAANSDPEKECGGFSMATGAGGAGGKGGAAGAGGAKTDASVPMDASASDAEAINPPDGGIVAMAASCGGTCSGTRSCAFASPGTSCGPPFCNTRKDLANLLCDGKGSCGIGLTDCTGGYACNFLGKPMAACRTTCSANVDCLNGYYCNGNNICALTKSDGLVCATDAECLHNHCATGVCCNTACDSPNSCNNQGSAGKCQCPGVTNCGTGVACQIFYQDADGDGYGNKNGVLGTTAKAGCAGTPPTGFVADNTDCDDGDANVHPGQTGWFGTPSKGIGTFDYDCDLTYEMYYHQYPGAACKFCPDACSAGCTATPSSTCASTGATGSLACTSTGICLGTILNSSDIEIFSASTGVSVPPITKINNGCCGCNDHGGYTQSATVMCGQTASYTTCSSCTLLNPNTAGTPSNVQQLCH